MNQLFRKEAVEGSRGAWLSDIVLITQPSFKWLAMLALLVSACLVMYLVMGSYTKKARATGYIVPHQGVLKVYSGQGGSIGTMLVREGQTVRRGQLLAVVSSERISGRGDTQLEIDRQLQLRKQSLEADIAKVEAVYAEQIAAITRRLEQAENEQAQLLRAMQSQVQRVSLADAAVNRATRLRDDQFISESSLQDRSAELLDQKGRLNELERNGISVQRDAESLRSELRLMPLKRTREIEALRRNLFELDAQRFDNEIKRESHIVAPQDGLVTALQSDVGRFVSPSQPIMSLIPTGSRLQADLYVTSRSIGFLKIGARAELQYEAFPFQKFGSQPGTVTTISRTSVVAQELPFPAAAGDAYYVVTITPDSEYISAYGQREHLQPGMQVSADIRVDRRTLLEWVLDPLFSVSGRL